MVLKNKKGSLDDLAYIILVVAFGGLLILIMGKWTDSFNTQIQASSTIPDDGKLAVNKVNNLYGDTIDNSFLFLTIGLCIASLILAMMVVIHPVFFVFYFILLAVIIYVGGAASNIYQYAAEQSELSAIADKLIFTSHICQYLPFIIGVFGFILAVVMYKTWRNNQFG